MQGRVGARPLTHLRGEAAFASRGNAALPLNLGTPTARHTYLGLRSALPRERSKHSEEDNIRLRRRFAAEEWVMPEDEPSCAQHGHE